MISLAFDYLGTRVRASDLMDRVFCARRDMAAGQMIRRDHKREAHAKYVLESFGAVELGCIDHYEPLPGSEADYLVQLEGDVHALCTFTAYAVPQLRSFGWRVDIDADYRYRVVDGDAPWYACVEPEQREDWFSLELGIDVEGKRINVLPALLSLIDRSAELESLEALMRSSRRLVALPIADGRYMTMPPERLQALVRVLIELYHGEECKVRFPSLAAASLAELGDIFAETITWHGEVELPERGRRLKSLATHAQTEPLPIASLKASLRPYQEQGLRWLQGLRALEAGGVLADDMGLGKTLQTIAHINAEKESGRMDVPSLVVAPTSLVGNWQREIRRFAPHLRVALLHGAKRHEQWDSLREADVILTTYPLLIRDVERLTDHTFHLLILDEAQAIKNNRSQAYRAVKALNARHHLCLTGTPVENNLDELWALFDVLMPGYLGTLEQFRVMFRNPIERCGSASRLEALRERVAPYILRRMKHDVVPELPPKTEIVRPVELSGGQRDLYESIRMAAHSHVRSAIKKKGIAASTIAILDALMKLRQVCCDPRLVTVASAQKVQSSAKYELFFDLLQKQLDQRRRVLVFSQFTSMLALISEGLGRAGIGHLALTGASQNRQKLVDTFEGGKADVFLISLKAGGTGLNLTSADTVIHYDPWWNPAAQAQATDRAYRIGQTRPVFVYNLIVAGSVEERMLRLQRHKKNLADNILSSEARTGVPLSEADLAELFAPLDD